MAMKQFVSGDDLSVFSSIIKGEFTRRACVEATLTAAGWSGAGPYTQVMTVVGMTPDRLSVVGLSEAATEAQRRACRAAMISPAGQAAGTVTLVADGRKPDVDLPVSVAMWF